MEKQEEHRRTTATSTVGVCACACVCIHLCASGACLCLCVCDTRVSACTLTAYVLTPGRVSVHVLGSLLLNILGVGGGERAGKQAREGGREGGASEVGE